MKKVLLFVDDPAARDEICQILSDRSELQVETADSPEQLLNVNEEMSVVLTNLPGLSLDFLEVWHHGNEASLSSVVVVTSPANEHVAVQALRQGAISYVPQSLLKSELLNTLESVFSVLQTRDHRMRIFDCMRQWKNEFELENDRSLIGPLVRYMQESTNRLGLFCDPSDAVRMGVALEEALINSMYHGNLEVPSELREEDDSKFYDMVEARLKETPYCTRRILVSAELSRDQAVFSIRDDGPGFDVANIPDPTDPSNLERVSGRGMLLMRTFMDSVEYNELGNRVTLTKRKKPCDES